MADEYKNCRNLASGSIRLLDSKECAKRKLTFVAWDVISGFNELEYLSEKLNKAQSLGFEIVPFGDFNFIANICENGDYPIDGLVFKFDNIAYGRSLGETSHHFKNAIAYKFYDEEYETYLENVEWTMGRTGILTPVAVFKTIDIDGSDVSRASLHNVSVMEELLKKPYINQKVWVSKRNMIIPQIEKAEQIDENYSDLDFINIPEACPICGGEVQIIDNDGVKVLMCLNPLCEGKLINRLDHFCGKKGLDIKGLSKATLEKLITWGWINNISDLMNLKNYRNEWIKKSGFGEKSVDKILEAIESAKTTTLEMFISSLGIPLIGQTVSKELISHISTYEEFRKLINERFDFSQFDGFAEEKTKALLNFNYTEADIIYKQLTIIGNNNTITNSTLNSYKFVITGKLNNFKNRNELKAVIESNGGKVVDSINKSVNFLINNDIQSASSKNVAAKKLNIPIISEKEFLESFDLTF